MKAIKILVSGNWAHFKKPETNNNPLTHDFITKTAFLGLIGAVLGIERDPMKEYFPILSEDLQYNVRLLNDVKKESWGFTIRYLGSAFEKAPKYFEILKQPKYELIIALKDLRSEDIFTRFTEHLINSEAVFTPILGLHNCSANIEFVSKLELSDMRIGPFKTNYFVSKEHRLVFDSEIISLGFERIPTYQNNNFWNLPNKYVEVVYPFNGKEITVAGDYYEGSTGERLWLI